MTPRQLKVCKKLNSVERSFLKRATREIFHGNGAALPRLQSRLRSLLSGRLGKISSAVGPFAALYTYSTENTATEVCPGFADDAFNEACPL
jgi:hypothetical protein